MKEVIKIKFGNYSIIFDRIGGDLYRPSVNGDGQKVILPFILEDWHIERVAKHINCLPTTDLPFDLFRMVVSGACRYATSWSMAE